MDLGDGVLEAGEDSGGGLAGDGVALVVDFLGEEFGGGRDDGGRQGDLAQSQHLGGGALAGAGVVGALGMRAVRPRWPGREALVLVTG
ncbi:hypothetical protein J2S46_000368 [Kitasatospora herbaricolor]|uniref:hypothetical protein n=1 Tax=Kitasatospora herbaricolor TaxID=68217 RepID=UPI00278CB8E9|nr:hypothetical protein [Kitasatospora herbaricolor]MDQ0305812.1 hypothetical protein [Kitasatospora herbaricolor]